MTRAGPLRWLTGTGWLILVGGTGEEAGLGAEIDDRILARADFSRPIAFLPTAGGSLEAGEPLLEHFADLGGPRGYGVPVLQAADAEEEEYRDLLAEAGIILVGDGDGLMLARMLGGSLALQGIEEAFARGALVVGVGAGSSPMGQWVVTTKTLEGERGWGWVSDAVVMPHFAGSAREPELQALLRARPGLVGLGIPEGVALALGPEGQVETWGEGEVTVVVAR